jgi:hypothetical protein
MPKQQEEVLIPKWVAEELLNSVEVSRKSHNPIWISQIVVKMLDRAIRSASSKESHDIRKTVIVRESEAVSAKVLFPDCNVVVTKPISASSSPTSNRREQ